MQLMRSVELIIGNVSR